jgi:hypothetical protein
MNPKVERLNSLLVQLICKEGLPFRLLESQTFQDFVQELDPWYKLPTHQAMPSRFTPDKYEAMKNKVKKTLASNGATAFTTDMWTSTANDSYMGVMVHHVDEAFELKSHCLAVRHAPGSHTAETHSSTYG